MSDTPQPAEKPKTRWFVPTPGKLVLLLLLGELLFLLADRFSLFGLKQGSGWNVLVAVGIFLLTVLIGLVWFGVSLLWRRSHFQFGIKTLFLLMGCVAVVGGWLGWKLERAKRQGTFIEMIGESNVTYDFEYSDGVELGESWPFNQYTLFVPLDEWKTPGPAWARRLLGDCFFTDITAVKLSGELDEQIVASLKALPRLECLMLDNRRITKPELELVQELHGLRLLYLPLFCSSIIDDDFTRSLPNCRISYLGAIVRFSHDSARPPFPVRRLHWLRLTSPGGIIDESEFE